MVRLTELTIGMLVAYTAIIALLGYIAYRRTKLTLDDYVLGSRLFGTFALVMTLSATWFTAFFYYGAMGTYYWGGLTFLTNVWWQFLLVAMYWTFGIRIWLLGKRYGYITPADLLSDYYQSKVVRLLVAILCIVFLLPYIQVQLIGSGIALNVISGGEVPFWLGAFLFFAMGTAYTLIGGMRSDVWTDIVQGIVLFGILFIALPVVVIQAGGLGNLFSVVAEKQPKLLLYPTNWNPIADYGLAVTFPIYLSFFLGFGIGGMVQPPIWQRFYIARSATVMRRTCLALLVFYAIAINTAPFIGLAGHVLVPGLKPPKTDEVFQLMATQYITWLAPIIVLGVWAAGMSTMDSQILSLGSFVSRDIYQRFIDPKASDKTLSRITQLALVAFAVIAFWGALARPGIITMIALVGVAALTNLITPLIGATMWPRATREGAIAGLLGGIVGTILFQFVVPAPWRFGFFAGIWGLFINVILFFGVSYLTKPMPKAIQDRFHGYLSSKLYKVALAANESTVR